MRKLDDRLLKTLQMLKINFCEDNCIPSLLCPSRQRLRGCSTSCIHAVVPQGAGEKVFNHPPKPKTNSHCLSNRLAETETCVFNVCANKDTRNSSIHQRYSIKAEFCAST